MHTVYVDDVDRATDSDVRPSLQPRRRKMVEDLVVAARFDTGGVHEVHGVRVIRRVRPLEHGSVFVLDPEALLSVGIALR